MALTFGVYHTINICKDSDYVFGGHQVNELLFDEWWVDLNI